MKRAIRFAGVLIGLLIGAVFIYLSVRSLDWPSVRATFAAANLIWVAWALPCLVIAFFLRLERWRIMLKTIGSRATRAELAAPFLGSFALNNVLPLRLGDVARAAAFQQRIGVTLSGGTASLLVERVLDLYALLLVGTVALLSLNAAELPFDPSILQSLVTGLGLVVAGLTALLIFPRRVARLGLWIGSSPIGKAVPSALIMFGVRTLLRISQIVRRAGTGTVMGLSVMAWLIEGGVIYCASRALNLNPEAGANWLALVAANLGTLLPGTPGHFGTYHYMGAHALTLGGPTFNDAVPSVTLAHFIIWAGITSAGFIALSMQRRLGTVLASKPRDNHPNAAP